jgi:hypothetical protein
VIYAIAPSRLADHDLWVGTDDGLIWRSRDEGAHWTDVTPPQLTPWSKVGILDTSHFDAETAYAAVDRHRLDDFKPYIYRTHDGGRHWQWIANGIPAGSFVNAVREDSVQPGLLYAGTEKGVYVSFDDGDHWQSLQANLPVTSVRDIDVHGNDLVIATHGRAFWVLDDVSPLRQLAADHRIEPAAPWLFAPATAVRLRPAGFTGTPFPKEEPAAPNPPSGAFIDYVLNAPAKSVSMEILDGQGGLVRRYSSADEIPKPDLTTLNTAPEWVAPTVALSTAPGMHRFVWPLHYAAPAGLSDRRRGGEGVWAPPGPYTVVLEVDGARLAQPLTVAPDPRIKLRPEDYARQFAMAREIEEARVQVGNAIKEAGDLLTGLGDRPTDKGLKARIEEITNPRIPGSLGFLADNLDRLMTAVDGSDQEPSPDAVSGFEQVNASLGRALAAWQALKATAVK